MLIQRLELPEAVFPFLFNLPQIDDLNGLLVYLPDLRLLLLRELHKWFSIIILYESDYCHSVVVSVGGLEVERGLVVS